MDKRTSPAVPPRLLSAWVREVPLCNGQRSMKRHITGRSAENKRLGAQPWVERLSQLPHPCLFQPRLKRDSQREDRKNVRGREWGEVLWIAIFWAWHGYQGNKFIAAVQHCMYGQVPTEFSRIYKYIQTTTKTHKIDWGCIEDRIWRGKWGFIS